jgi:hypothetical protein
MERNDLIFLDEATFFYSRPNSDVDADAGQGLFFRDPRGAALITGEVALGIWTPLG